MKTIKFYPNTRSQLNQNIFHIVLYAIILPIVLIPMLGKTLSSIPIIGLMILLLMGSGIILGIFLLKRSRQNIQEKDILTLEISKEGFRYPYLLDESINVVWSQIQNIEHIVVKGKRGYEHLVIELKTGVMVGDIKKVGRANCDYYQKNSIGQILVIPEDITGDYQLAEIYSLFRCYQKGLANLILPPEDLQVSYDDYSKNRVYFLIQLPIPVLGGLYAVYMLVVKDFKKDPELLRLINEPSLSLLMEQYQQMPSKFMLLAIVSLLFVVAIVGLFYWLLNLKSLFVSQHAISMNAEGLQKINRTDFGGTIRWIDIQSVEIERRKKGNYKVPFLIIKLKDHQGNIETFTIRNALEFTSVYELYEIMKSHYLFNGF